MEANEGLNIDMREAAKAARKQVMSEASTEALLKQARWWLGGSFGLNSELELLLRELIARLERNG